MDLSMLTTKAIEYDAGDPRRVQHFMKVYAFCHAIGTAEGLSAHEQELLDAAAILHDIGIHNAEHAHSSSAGNWQELEGPPVARMLLHALGWAEDAIERICWLIAHHHSHHASEELPFRILLEADFLVNAYEDALPRTACEAARDRIFRTETGKHYLAQLFLAPPWQA